MGALALAGEQVGEYDYVELQKMAREDIYDDICNVRQVLSRLKDTPQGGEKRRFITEVREKRESV